jgi:biopolymer transport protein ExbD
MKIKLGNEQNDAPRVEVVPLIDIIFCILIFFLLSGLQMARQQAINVDIPKAKTAEAQTRELFIVSLGADGQTFVEQQPVPHLELLFQQVKSYRNRNPNGSIVLYASKQVKYERVIEVLDLLREAGGDNVALATTSNEPAPATPSLSPQPTLTVPPLPGLAPAPLNTAPINPVAPPASSTVSPSLLVPTPLVPTPSPGR